MARGKSIRWKGLKPSAYARRFRTFNKMVESEFQASLRTATDIVRDYEKARAWPVRSVGATDSHDGRPKKFSGRTPVRRKVIKEDRKGQVWVRPYYTNARTPAVKALFTKYGLRSLLTREGLKVRRGKRKRAKLIKFAEDPGLKKWAIERKMIARQRIRMERGIIVRDMLHRPALTRNSPYISRLYKSAFVRAGMRSK